MYNRPHSARIVPVRRNEIHVCRYSTSRPHPACIVSIRRNGVCWYSTSRPHPACIVSIRRNGVCMYSTSRPHSACLLRQLRTAQFVLGFGFLCFLGGHSNRYMYCLGVILLSFLNVCIGTCNDVHACITF